MLAMLLTQGDRDPGRGGQPCRDATAVDELPAGRRWDLAQKRDGEGDRGLAVGEVIAGREQAADGVRRALGVERRHGRTQALEERGDPRGARAVSLGRQAEEERGERGPVVEVRHVGIHLHVRDGRLRDDELEVGVEQLRARHVELLARVPASCRG